MNLDAHWFLKVTAVQLVVFIVKIVVQQLLSKDLHKVPKRGELIY
jgi:hypothetical protein